jgi:hypothetical protein
VVDSNIYFGTPGSLITLVNPKGGIAGTRVRDTTVFPLGSGGQQVWKMLGGKRTYRLDYQGLDYASFATLHAYEQGHNGTGPFALLDPGQRNQLTANQSGATSETNDTSNFTVAGSGGTITSDTALFLRGPRSLKWSFSVTNPGNGATLTLNPPATEWVGTPIALRPYTFWAMARAAAGSGPVSFQAKMAYLTAAGGANGSDTGNLTAATSAAWVTISVTGTPPAASAYLNCSLVGSAGTITSGEAVNFDEFMLNEGSTADSVWAPGTGVVPVIFVQLPDQQPFLDPSYRSGPVATLQEVGA